MPKQERTKNGVKVHFTSTEVGDILTRAALAYLGLPYGSEEIGICATPITDVTVDVTSFSRLGTACNR